MRHPFLPTLLALWAIPLAAQAPDRGWAIHLAVARDAFSGGSSDTSTIPGIEVEVTPAPRIALATGLTRQAGAWEFGLELGYTSGGLRASTEDLRVEERTNDVARFRAALTVGRRLARSGPVSVVLLASPGVDRWETEGIGNRTTLALRGGLVLRIPFGRVEFENRLLAGIGGSPFRGEDIPPGGKAESLRTFSLGAALRLRL
ncbi:MAG: hypothetical protein SF070_19155 [Gemmatimonadota bacterium]|nr:hypothetical protein [Gemmatimonadota bacterium]